MDLNVRMSPEGYIPEYRQRPFDFLIVALLYRGIVFGIGRAVFLIDLPDALSEVATNLSLAFILVGRREHETK